jgi:hypothetical protein
VAWHSGPDSAAKIKRAPEFFRIQNARAALPQNCSIKMYDHAGNLKMARGCQSDSTKVLACKSQILKSKSNVESPAPLL